MLSCILNVWSALQLARDTAAAFGLLNTLFQGACVTDFIGHSHV